jgi:hypothetical protein
MTDISTQGCPICIKYFHEASLAIRRHLRAVGALEMAVSKTEMHRYAELKTAVGEASIARENAVARYESHGATHVASRAISAGGPGLGGNA